jgi:hypothetical protein
VVLGQELMAAMRPTLFGLAFALASLLAPIPARAGGPTPELHVTAGVEIEGTRGITSVGFRGQALLGTQLRGGRLRPSLAAGVAIGSGALYVDDSRAASGSVGVGYTSLGPAMQLGLHLYGHDGHEAGFLFASAASLRTSTDERLRFDAVHGVDPHSDKGARASLGINWARSVSHHISRAASGTGNPNGLAAVLLFALPAQLEFTVERDTGSTREGATFSWGF